MKRLERNLESTAPFVNSDFNDILQEQHRIAYSAYLDGINDMSFQTYSTNRGIVLSGIEVTAKPKTIPIGKFDWEFKINRSTAVVYFDGQYYTPSDAILSQSDDQEIEVQFLDTNIVMLYPFTQSINDRNRNIFQVRQYLQDLKGPGQGTYGSQSVTWDYRFDIVSFPRTGNLLDINENFSEQFPPTLAQSPYQGSTQGVPYILYSWGGTSRSLTRLLKLNTTAKDDILITHDLKKWQLGTGPGSKIDQSGFSVDGFVFRDFAWTINTDTNATYYETYFLTGRNELKGYAGLTTMSGRFPVGYDPTISTSPYEAGFNQFNYGTPSNIGGSQSVLLTSANLPAHNHSGFTEPTAQNLDHSHLFYAGIPGDSFGGSLDPQGIGFGEYQEVNAAGFPEPQDQVFLTRSKPYFMQQISLPENLMNPRNHKHRIDLAGNEIPHENRPSYTVALYYYKL